MDLVAEIVPAFARGHRYILCLIDTCTRWVECIPLKYATTPEKAEGLCSIFCCMGFPDVIRSGNGSQFVLRTMQCFTEMLSIGQAFSSIYHPCSNGIIDKLYRCL